MVMPEFHRRLWETFVKSLPKDVLKAFIAEWENADDLSDREREQLEIMKKVLNDANT